MDNESKIPLEDLAKRLGSDLKNGLSLSKVKDHKNKKANHHPHHSPPLSLHQMACFLSLFVLLKALVAIAFYVSLTVYMAFTLPFFLIAGCLLLLVLIETWFFYFHYGLKVTKSLSMIHSKRNKLLVLREGVSYSVFDEEVCRGDVVVLREGDVVPADMRVIEAELLKVDSYSLTGVGGVEMKRVDVGDDDDNMIYAPSVVVEGKGKGMVVKIGKESKLGQINEIGSTLKKPLSIIARELDHILWIFVAFSFFFAFLVFTICFVCGYNWYEGISFFIYVFFINIPETVLTAFAVSLYIFAERMLKRGVLLRDVRSLACMGNTSVLVIDKSALVKVNKSVVSHVFLNGLLVKNTENKVVDRRSEAWKAFCRVGMLCNEASFLEGQDKAAVEDRDCTGDAVDGALLRFMEAEVGDVIDARRRSPKSNKHPTHALHNIQISVNRSKEGLTMATMKGALEDILQRCDSVLVGDKEVELTPLIRHSFREVSEKLERIGERVLAFCDLKLEKEAFEDAYLKHGKREGHLEEWSVPDGGFRLLGVVSMVDALRRGVAETLVRCRMAGIRIVMVTGDNPMIAKSVAMEANILTNKDAIATEQTVLLDDTAVDVASTQYVMEGTQVSLLTPPLLIQTINHFDELIFAKMNAPQKLQVVQTFQKLGHVVMVIGNGASDALALRAADVGVTMGTPNNIVTSNMADVVVVDGGIDGVMLSIEQGRLFIENLKKTIIFMLSTTLPFIVSFALYLLLDLPLVVTLIVMFILKHGTDIIPAISLAYETPEEDVMERKGVRKVVEDSVLNSRSLNVSFAQTGMIHLTGAMFSYVFIMAQNGFFPSRLMGLRGMWSVAKIDDLEDSYGREWTFEDRESLLATAHTMFFVTIATMQLCNVVMCKSKIKSFLERGMHNHYLTFSLFFSTTIMVLCVYLPFCHNLGFQPLMWSHWLLPLPFCLLLIGWEEVRKYLLRKFPKGWLHEEMYY